MNGSEKQSFVIIGSINQDDKVSVFESYLTSSDVLISEDSTDSDYTVAFLDKAGATLAENPFTVSFKTPHLSFPLLTTVFSVVRPFPSSTASVEIRRSQKVLLRLERSPTAPIISNLSVLPSIDSQFNKNLSIEWQASDPDGDELTFSISYSVNQGKTFLPVEGGLKKTKLSLTTLGLSGSKDALIKVSASDGFNTAEAISNPFTIPTTAPVATILWPQKDNENIDFTSKKPFLFRGAALDVQDGVLDGKSLAWFLVELHGEHLLGYGSELLIKSLPIGVHTIRLVATDQDGKSGSDERVIIAKKSFIDEVKPITEGRKRINRRTKAFRKRESKPAKRSS
jgi:hypothetical protein